MSAEPQPNRPPQGRVVSVNTGLPREIEWGGKTITTGIFKEAVRSRLTLRTLNFEGDGQADLSVHGGAVKAAYAYPDEHYDFWRVELSSPGWPWGMFGENLTTHGLDESTVWIGDRFRIGSAEVMVTQPRLPCYKLGIKFGREDMPRRFLASGRTGFYLAVLREGDIGAGDAIECVGREENSLSISRSVQLYFAEDCSEDDVRDLRAAVGLKPLSEGWRARFRDRLKRSRGSEPGR